MATRCRCNDGGDPSRRRRAWAARPCTAVVLPSVIPNAGDGLFAERDYGAGEFVTFYSGCYRWGDDVEGDRALEFRIEQTVDGDGPCRVAAAPGDKCNHSRRANCRYRLDTATVPGETLVQVVAARKVHAGQELLCNYGPWFQFD